VSVYGRRPDAAWEFWTLSLSSSDARKSEIGRDVQQQMRDSAVLLQQFVWSPSGDRLYFVGRAREGEDVWRVAVDRLTLRWSSGPDRLTNDGGRQPGLALSPDGRRLAFTRRLSQTRIWALPFDPVEGRLTGHGEPLTPFGSEAFVVDMSPDGQQLAYRTVHSGREELWVHTVSTTSSRLAATEERAQILQPRWSMDGQQLAYLRLASASPTDSGVVLVDSKSTTMNGVLPQSRGTTQVYDWAPDGRSLLVGCRNDRSLIALCTLPVHANDVTSPSPRVIADDPERNLYSARTSPNKRWIVFLTIEANADMRGVFVMPADGGGRIPVTDNEYVDKPRWSPDGSTIYYAARQHGVWNLWGRRFDRVSGQPTGQPFQVTRYDEPAFSLEVSGNTQLSITRDRLVVPITESAGAVWILENVNR